MLGAVLARLLFAAAAIAALAASAGVAVPPHQELPGTPLYHGHVLSAYRFDFLLPSLERETSPLMSKLHQTLLSAGVPINVIAQMPGMTIKDGPTELPVIKSAALSPIQDLAIELALLVVVIARLTRPTQRAIAEFLPPVVPLGAWQLAPIPPPPRVAVLP